MKRLRNMIVVLSVVLILLGVMLTAVLRMPVKEKPQEKSTPVAGTGQVSDSVRPSSEEDQTGQEEEPTQEAPVIEGEASEDTPSEETQKEPEPGDEFLMLVNAENPMPEGYEPAVSKIYGGDYKFDSRVVDKLNLMMGEAYEQGVVLWPLSAYRSVESQTRNFNNKLEENKAAGYSDEDAYIMTARYIAVPGTSEHSIGLAVDLNSLEESFDQTPAFAWLIKNCANYGFILRYPEGKEDITGIAYEPWHYRYVGEEHAKKIMEKGICLEEYLLERAAKGTMR